jgi:ppGpp synthetase/RelA/SpoT-type nucleotidyltranferase
MAMSKTQVDRLGERLKGGSHAESDLRLLDEYRRSFGEVYEVVVGTIRRCGGLPTGRPAKSTDSIVEKLKRESIRLSQMQDVAGCRVVVANVVEQDKFVVSLRNEFPEASVMDRRDKPSHGYRAVHVIVEIGGKAMEVQVRTALQHLWAEVSEKCSDVLDPAIKYGGGPESWRASLTNSSELVAAYEKLEQHVSGRVAEEARGELAREMERIQGELAVVWNMIAERLNKMIALLDQLPLDGLEP